MPEQELPTASVHLQPPAGLSANELARRLRTGEPAVYPRVQEAALILDARTLFPEQVAPTAAAVAAVLHQNK